MENYDFIYQDSSFKWDICKNPVFIARHTFCRAIPKDVTKWGFKNVKSLLRWLNDNSAIIKDKEQEDFLKEYIW